MNFNSASFGLFILVVLTAYFALQATRRFRAQNWLLLVASYVFYGAWDHRFLFLIVISTVIDYCAGLGIVGKRPDRRSTWSIASLLVGASVFLCAPIDWQGMLDALRPVAAPAWRTAPSDASWRLLDGTDNWGPLIGAVVASVVVCVAVVVGFRVRSGLRPRYFLLLSLFSNLTLLGFFKYFDFFVESAGAALSGLGFEHDPWVLGIVVPVGISFYTFQTLSYTIDIYRGELEPTEHLWDFALFVSFFPQLVAGPIERARVLLPQLLSPRVIRWDCIQAGTYLVAWGLFKKIFIADNLAGLVTPVFAADASPTGPEILLGTYAFAFQIYCDFSGYSDIARGLGRIMGIELMVNFNVPYVATNPQEFWRRWHISLSTWLRDYLYISLGGNRGGSFFVYRNLMITMVLGGLWHGARANFVWWGIYQGALLCVHRAVYPYLKRVEPEKGPAHIAFRLLCWIAFFHLMCYGWLLFRVDTNAQLLHLTGSLVTGWETITSHLGVLARIAWFTWPLIVIQVFQERSKNLLQPLTWSWPVRWAVYATLFYLTTIFGAFDVIEFIYFQF